jgi:glutamate dehydrogenase
MLNKVDDAKSDVLIRAADAAAHGNGAGPAAPGSDTSGRDTTTPVDPAFLERYYRHVPTEDLLPREPADVLGAAMSHRQLAGHRPQGTAKIRVFNPGRGEHGWTSDHTVVEIVTDDMPFLVDSVTAELTRQDRSIHLVVHPQLVVRRDIAGALQAVLGETDAGDAPDDAMVESWIHIEIDRDSDADALAAVVEDLQRILRDVREAVEDWGKMREAATRVAAELPQRTAGVDGQEVAEAQELLRWLADDHFTFLGYREYVLETRDGEDSLRAVPASGLGILRADQTVSPSFGRLAQEVRDRARERTLLVLTKANSRSTVHRPAYLDYVGVKTFDADGAVVGEQRFLGLLTSAAYTESVQRIPVLRRKVAEVLERTGFSPNSHSGKDLLTVLETYPRDELFQTSVEDLYAITTSVLHLQERRRLRLFLRRDDYGRFMSCMVYLPRDRWNTQVRLRMEAILRESFDAASVDYTARISESVLARLHFVVRVAPGTSIPEVDPVEVEARLMAATRSWDDDYADALVKACGEEDGRRMLRSYVDAFPEAYKEDFPATDGVADLRRLVALDGQDSEEQGTAHAGDRAALAMDLYQPEGAGPGERRFKLFRNGPVSLSAVLPMLREMGVEVTDERPYEIVRADGRSAWIYDFGLRYEPTGETPPDNAREQFQDAFAAVWSGAAESDGFNALVLRGGLTWRQASVLRAYAKYLRQGGTTFSQDYLEQVLVENVGITRLLVRLFESRFNPAYASGGDERNAPPQTEISDGFVEEIQGALDEVASLDHDRILRAFLAVICATSRTSYFQTTPEGGPKPYVSFKLDPQKVPDLPQPRPRYEIWVYGPRVEGVHLRFGPVARGGLRWSDRREDFRTEVLGLVKAQIVKNAVIVPTGAKGGFVVKRPPDPADREAFLAEGIACYKRFISGLLDVTDNLVNGEVVPPPDVVRHDGDDTYLVVAADKGTAAFSDIANGVAIDYGFWLGDAFASGGSAGYDHKAMGITARGAWESVRRHFREMGVDTQTEDFTVVGIGDMSGDVFGNGVLLSEHIRLVAAFDHRHIFLDPDPDPATSFAERQRLFALPRSSWADYDTALISPGGGVHPRTAKSIPVSPQVRERLGLPEDVTRLTPQELMRAVIAAPVDLFWNGGIGTYVKASTEPHSAVGDKANDAIRVDGRDLRVRVVGEGGNLGLTQLGRIEYARSGGRVNTDAIDNSAGVDCSDHEVNIKVLLDQVCRDGDLDGEQRNALLAEMTEDVAALVLRDNVEQNILLGNARQQAGSMLTVHKRFIRSMERAGALDRGLEFLPTDKEIDQRQAGGGGLTSPEFAVLVAYSKIRLKAEILRTELPAEAWFGRALRSYFPQRLVVAYEDRLDRHPLRRDIITTCVANDVVNRAGTTFVFRAQEETGASAVEVTRAYTVTREVFDFEQLWADIAALDNVVPTRAQGALYLEGRRAIDRAVRWLLQSRRSTLDVVAEIQRFGPDVAELCPQVPDLLRGVEREQMLARAKEFTEMGVPEELAVRTASLLYAFELLDVVGIARASGRAAADVAPLHYALSERFGVDVLLTRITGLARSDRWTALARSALRYDLYAVLADLTASVLAETEEGQDPDARIAAWEEANAEGVARSRGTLEEIAALDKHDLATLSVALRTIRTLLRSGGTPER